MTKNVKLRRIKTSIPDDVFVSSIDGILGTVKDVNLDVYFTSKKIYELENTMFVVLDMYDSSDEMKALLVGNRDKDFTSLVDSIKFGLKYRVVGNVSILTNDEETAALPFIDELNNSRVFCIYALQCYSDTFLGVDVDEFNINLELQDQYDIVSKYTDYFKDYALDQVKDIKVSCYNELFYLLTDGSLLVNDMKELDNIDMIHYIDNHTIVAIGSDKTITCLTKKHVSGANFLNSDNYQYKKILTNEFGVVALRDDGVVVYFGTIVSSVIDYSRFTDVDDIGYVEENDDIVVIKDGKVFSLFHQHDYSNEKPDVLVEGSLDDLEIIGE